MPTRPPGFSTRRELGEAALEVGDVADAEADGRRVERGVRERELEQVALDPLERRVLAAGAYEHRLGEVEPDHLGAGSPRRDREIAGAAARVEHSVA